MKLPHKYARSIILLIAIQFGYDVSFDEETLRDYLTDKKPIPPPFIPQLERESNYFSRQICLDGRMEEANKIAEAMAIEAALI